MSHKVLVEWTIPFMARGSEFPWLCLKIHLPLIHTDNTDATNAWQLGGVAVREGRDRAEPPEFCEPQARLEGVSVEVVELGKIG